MVFLCELRKVFLLIFGRVICVRCAPNGKGGVCCVCCVVYAAGCVDKVRVFLIIMYEYADRLYCSPASLSSSHSSSAYCDFRFSSWKSLHRLRLCFTHWPTNCCVFVGLWVNCAKRITSNSWTHLFCITQKRSVNFHPKPERISSMRCVCTVVLWYFVVVVIRKCVARFSLVCTIKMYLWKLVAARYVSFNFFIYFFRIHSPLFLLVVSANCCYCVSVCHQ